MQDAGLEMSKSTISHHLRILRLAGVVTKRHEGTKGYMSLRKDDLDRRFPGLIGSILSADAEGPGVPVQTPWPAASSPATSDSP
jgi:DNA-binding transcriptional ArsR family regulator